MWLFPHPETAILPLERLPWGSASSYRRIAARGGDKLVTFFSQKSQFFTKFDSFFGLESGNFSLFLGTQLDPETTSLRKVSDTGCEQRELLLSPLLARGAHLSAQLLLLVLPREVVSGSGRSAQK